MMNRRYNGRSGAGNAQSAWARIANLPFYPIVAAIALPLQIIASNSEYIRTIADLIRPLAIFTISAIVMIGLSSLALRSLQRGGWLTALCVLVLIYGTPPATYGSSFLKAVLGLDVQDGALIIALLVVACVAGIQLRPSEAFTRAANAAAAAVLAYNIVAFGLIALERGEASIVQATPFEPPSNVAPVSQATRPDIYHIVVDGYGRSDVLQDIYRFDNSDFIEQLEGLGFDHADQAVTPYNQTLMIMNSMFNGNYIQNLPENPGITPQNYRRKLYNELQRNSMFEVLRGRGYGLYSVRSEYPLVQLEEMDKEFLARPEAVSFLELAVFRHSGLFPITELLSRPSTASGDNKDGGEPGGKVDNGSAENALGASAIAIIEQLDVSFPKQLKSPFFFYTHIIAPHPPFDVDRMGGFRDSILAARGIADGNHSHYGIPETQREYWLGYLEKLQFTNREVLRYVTQVINERPDPKIIVIHGDHGGGLYLDHADASTTCLRERFSPLLAVYSSDGRLQEAIPNDLNLVNLYRVIFNEYFGADIAMLPGKSFFVPWKNPMRHDPISNKDMNAICPVAPWEN
jgi:hypothetical protein